MALRKLTLRRLRKIRIRVLVSNVPESGKRGLLRDRLARAARYFNLLGRHRIDIALTQESGTYAERVAARRDRWRAFYATMNNFIRGRRIGNGVILNWLRFKVVDETELVIDGLHMPVVLIRHRATGWRFVVINLHAPTRTADPDNSTRSKITREVRAYLVKLGDVPVLVGGDLNDGDWGREFRRQLNVSNHHVVDWLLASEHFRTLATETISDDLISDHDFIESKIRAWLKGAYLESLPTP